MQNGKGGCGLSYNNVTEYGDRAIDPCSQRAMGVDAKIERERKTPPIQFPHSMGGRVNEREGISCNTLRS